MQLTSSNPFVQMLVAAAFIADVAFSTTVTLNFTSTIYAIESNNFMKANCSITSNPLTAIKVRFFHNDTEIVPIHPYKIKMYGRTTVELTKFALSSSDTGIYHCKATFSSGLYPMTRSSNSKYIYVRHEPKSRHVHVHFQEGGKGVLHCPANGFPTELVKWKDPNGVDLDDTVNSTHPVYVTRNGALHIDVVTTSNEGVFTCIQFSYYFGRLENTVDVTVSEVFRPSVCSPMPAELTKQQLEKNSNLATCEKILIKWSSVVVDHATVYKLSCQAVDELIWHNYTITDQQSSFTSLPPEHNYSCMVTYSTSGTGTACTGPALTVTCHPRNEFNRSTPNFQGTSKTISLTYETMKGSGSTRGTVHVPSDLSNKANDGLSKEATGGIICACVFGLVLLCLIVVLAYKRRLITMDSIFSYIKICRCCRRMEYVRREIIITDEQAAVQRALAITQARLEIRQEIREELTHILEPLLASTTQLNQTIQLLNRKRSEAVTEQQLTGLLTEIIEILVSQQPPATARNSRSESVV